MPTEISAKTNITIKLDKSLVRRIRVLAAEQGTSISALIAARFEEELNQRGRYESAKKSAMAAMRKGLNLGERPLTREEMHEPR